MADRERLFSYAVIQHPTKKERDEGKRSKLIISPEYVLAHNDHEVIMRATRGIPAELMEDADRLEVAVRPF